MENLELKLTIDTAQSDSTQTDVIIIGTGSDPELKRKAIELAAEHKIEIIEIENHSDLNFNPGPAYQCGIEMQILTASIKELEKNKYFEKPKSKFHK